jgi:hypothetical protein
MTALSHDIERLESDPSLRKGENPIPHLAPPDDEIDVEELRVIRAALAHTALNAFAGHPYDSNTEIREPLEERHRALLARLTGVPSRTAHGMLLERDGWDVL